MPSRADGSADRSLDQQRDRERDFSSGQTADALQVELLNHPRSSSGLLSRADIYLDDRPLLHQAGTKRVLEIDEHAPGLEVLHVDVIERQL